MRGDARLKTILTPAGLALALAVALAACGGGGEQESSVAPTQAQQTYVGTALSPDLLMRWAEGAYPDYFSPPGQRTQWSSPYVYRYYPATRTYLGIAGQDLFVQGALFETESPRRVASISDYQCTVVPAACWPGSQVVPVVRAPVDAYTAWPRKTYVIRDAQQWAAAWAERTDFSLPPAPLPDVDFSTYAILGGADGWSSDGCGGIEAKLILRQGSDYRVLWGTHWTSPYSACTQALMPRAAFVLVPQPVGNVEFIQVPAY